MAPHSSRDPALRRRADGHAAFTLIELLVVVAIIALLISILLPALSRARNHGKSAVCRSNLHQLVVSETYYAQENGDRLLYIRPMSYNEQTGATTYPFRQYDQIFMFWPYLKDLKIYRCPAASGENGVKNYEQNVKLPGTERHSVYTVLKADDAFLRAYQNGWWPEIVPTEYTGDKITPLYTEYWCNDWFKNAKHPISGRPIPAVSGGLISKIPVPANTVVISDAVYDAAVLRHNDQTQIAFLDAHVASYKRLYYFDNRGNVPSDQKQDWDSFRNRPFWVWGLTKNEPGGFDADPS